jgi:hypothetical protein
VSTRGQFGAAKDSKGLAVGVRQLVRFARVRLS